MSIPVNKMLHDATNSIAKSGLDSAATDVGSEQSAAGGEIERTDFPCSVAQERFWLLDRLDPGNSAYNVAVRWRLEGRVSSDVLERAWLQIIERHEILRSVFVEVEGTPIQRVTPQARFRLSEIDLSNLPPESQQAEGDRIGIIEARAPFDLAAGPLIRATLLRFSPTLSIILVTTHQVVSDGWSIGVMAREMGVIYSALRREQPVVLEPLAIQYADYSLWQLEWLRVRGIAAETAYWTKQLEGVKPFKVLPDYQRPSMPTANGAIVSRVLPRDLTNRAKSLCTEHGATLFAAALAALCMTLARYTNQTDIILGTQVSDRDQVELEPMIGQFVNSLILRNNLSGNPTFGQIVDNVRDTVAQALEHRHIPIERLLGIVKGERGYANTPPISVNFIFQKTFIQNARYEDFDLVDMPSLPTGAIYDLNFFMVERLDGWRFSCQYHTDQFEAATAERLIGYFQNVLENAVADAQKRLRDVCLCPPNEARLLLNKLNDTRSLYPRDVTLPKLFEAQATRAPQAIAVLCGERQITYAQLDASAKRVAARLHGLGVAAGSRVAVCLKPSLELPICWLAVLKLGAAFIAIDPSDPPRRRAEVLALSKAAAMIGRNLQAAGIQDSAVKMLDIDAALAGDGAPRGWIPAAPTKSDAAACLIVTAGSQAAGLASVTHRSLANLICSVAKRPGVDDRDVFVATSPPNMDRAPFEVFLPLILGARLVIALDKDLLNGRALLTLLQRTGASAMYGTARLWSGLTEAGWVGYPSLKMLCSVQEAGSSLMERPIKVGGELWALYGHSDAGIWSAARLVKADQGFVAVGEPIANTTLQVLDSNHEAAPVGAVGELFVGGDGLSMASTGDASGGANLHRTGDLARLRTTGQVELLGRTDQRFRYRDWEVDPADIERVLLLDSRVAQACVVHVEDPAGEDYLAAHVVPRATAAIDRQALTFELQAGLAEALPAHLIPQNLGLRATLPRTASGEVDRQALQGLQARPHRDKSADVPVGETETQVADIWAQILGVPSIAATDNFFEMGGHSLLAARMLARVERAVGRRVKLAALFLAPTPREFAKLLIQDDLREFDFRQVVKIQPHGSKSPLIVINNTGIYYSLAKCLGPEQPVYSLQLFDPSVKNTALPDSLEEIAARYIELLKRVQPQGPYSLMGWCVAGALAFEVARQLTQANEEVSHLFLMDSWVPRYIARLPWLRRVIAEYSLRLQFILTDWTRVLTGRQSVWNFLKNRQLVIKMQESMNATDPRPADTEPAPTQYANIEDYDQWLLHYLERTTAKYEPKVYSRRITLFRSRREPTGLWFDPLAGWGQFTSAGVDMHMLDGNHFTMFQEPGVTKMAADIETKINAADAR